MIVWYFFTDEWSRFLELVASAHIILNSFRCSLSITSTPILKRSCHINWLPMLFLLCCIRRRIKPDELFRRCNQPLSGCVRRLADRAYFDGRPCNSRRRQQQVGKSAPKRWIRCHAENAPMPEVSYFENRHGYAYGSECHYNGKINLFLKGIISPPLFSLLPAPKAYEQ